LGRKDLRAAEGGWESPEKTRFGSWRGATGRTKPFSKTQKGRSAGRGGSCPTSRVWFCPPTRSSYESTNQRSYFAPAPGTGMTLNIAEIGNDLEFRGAIASPTLRIDGMTMGGVKRSNATADPIPNAAAVNYRISVTA
jgi:hypothetical protein